MMRRRLSLILPGAALALLLAAPPAPARDRGPLGDITSYLRIVSPKGELIARTARLGDRVRRAERNGDLRRSEADDFYRRLERVRNFLRDDRHLTRDEFERRDADLDRIERDLDRKLDERQRRDRRRRDR